jgi:isoleucyl-tRNA synthetase
LAVGEDIDYVEVLDKETNEKYILAKERLEKYYKNEQDYEIVAEYK